MAAIYGEAYDRTPVIPLVIQHALHAAKIPHREYSSNASRMFEAQLYALNKYGYDGIHITTDNQIIPEALGCEIYLPYDEPPQYRSRILADKKDLSRVKKDFDPYNAGRMPVILEATRIARENLGENYFIKVNCDAGAFTVAAALRGEEKFFMDLYDDIQFVYDLLEICCDAVIKYVKAIAGSGAHAITFGDSTAGLIGRDFYKKFALPFQKRVVDSIKSFGLPAFMHVCGDTNDLIELMACSGADVLEVDSQTDLEATYVKTDCKVCLEGNLHPTEVLLQGTEQLVYNESVQCIKKSRGRLLILSSGCEVPRFTPEENIKAMVKASMDYSFTN